MTVGEQLDALPDELRNAVIWLAWQNMEEFSRRHPSLAGTALSPSTVEAVAEDIVRNGNLGEILARYKAALAPGTCAAAPSLGPNETDG
jgi:hypothetical protein